MSSGKREINIFNMSLLDILCGALGAFCFMMLVLLPYYKTAGGSAGKEAEEILKNLESIKQALKDAGLAPQLAEQLQALQNKISQLQGELNRLQNENRQKEEQIRELDRKVSGLEMRNPFVLGFDVHSKNHNADLYLQSNTKSGDGRAPPPPDPAQRQWEFWNGDKSVDCSQGPCNEQWLVRDTPAGSQFKVFYKFRDAGGNPEPAQVQAYLLHGNLPLTWLPRVSMPQAKSVAHVGTIVIGKDYKPEFRPQPEFEESYRKANTKGEPKNQ